MTYPSTPDTLPEAQAMCEKLKGDIATAEDKLFMVGLDLNCKAGALAHAVECRDKWRRKYDRAEADLRARDARTCDTCVYDHNCSIQDAAMSGGSFFCGAFASKEPAMTAPDTATRRCRRGPKKSACIGLCLHCGSRLTYCGIPFTAEIPCRKCLSVNVYMNSRQPVEVKRAL